MLSRELLRNDPERIRRAFIDRGQGPATLDEWLQIDAERRGAVTESSPGARSVEVRDGAVGDERHRPVAWHCRPEHRPLGAMNRARRDIYKAMAAYRDGVAPV